MLLLRRETLPCLSAILYKSSDAFTFCAPPTACSGSLICDGLHRLAPRSTSGFIVSKSLPPPSDRPFLTAPLAFCRKQRSTALCDIMVVPTPLPKRYSTYKELRIAGSKLGKLTFEGGKNKDTDALNLIIPRSLMQGRAKLLEQGCFL